MNTTAACKHVGEIERSNRTIQEHLRAIFSFLPYSILPKKVVIHMIYFVVTSGECNAGKVFLNKKGMLLDTFCMWLVRNGIANLLSIPCLECNRYQVTYDTNTCWLVNCLNGLTLKFKKDVGICEGFHYITWKTLKIM